MRYSFRFILALSLAFLPSCKQNRESGSGNSPAPGFREIHIEGSIEKGSGKELILEEMAAREFIPMDTVICGEDGSFSISFQNDQEAFYALRSESGSYSTLLINPGEHLQFKGDVEGEGNYEVRGSPGSELLQELAVAHKKTLDQLAGIAREKAERHFDPNFVELSMELERKFDSITDAFQSYSRNFIHQNQPSLSILIALYNLYGQGLPVFNPAEELDMYIYVDSVLKLSHPDSEFVRALHEHVSGARAGQKQTPGTAGPHPGEIAPDFVSSRADGTEVALSDFKDSFVLLSFWASWSSGSREEHPFLREAWERFENKGLVIVQIGFERDKQDWQAALEADELHWIQLSDLKGWDCPVADIYRVEKIPSNYLIGPDGEILAKDLYGEKLLQWLEQNMN